MRSIFNMDGPIFTFMSRVADLIILNLLFILCSLPIFTIGASFTALSYVTLKISEKEEGYIVKPFFKAFRENFRQATVIWLILLAAAIILFLDFQLAPALGGTAASVIRVMVIIGCICWICIFLYVFPLTARFSNTTGNMLRNSLLVSMANFPKVLLTLAVIVGAVILSFLNTTTFIWSVLVWLMGGFSLISYVNSRMQLKIFHKLAPEEEEEENPDAWTVDDKDDKEDEEPEKTAEIPEAAGQEKLPG